MWKGHNIPVAMLKCCMVVSSPRGDMPARQVCPKVKIALRGGGGVKVQCQFDCP
jgi:hypothetical protein